MGLVSKPISGGQTGVDRAAREGIFYTDKTILAKIYLRSDELSLEGIL